MVEHESNLITYYISQQIKRFHPSNSSHHLTKNTENMILKLPKFILNRMDLGQMLDTKKRCTFLTSNDISFSLFEFII
jgi:hypothetical protein